MIMIAIFDLDGTITDSMGYWRGMDREFLSRHGVKDPESLPTIYDRDWMEKILELVNSRHGLSLTKKDMHEWILENIYKHYSNDVTFKPGAHELLEKLSEMGIRMCICSSTDRYLMEPALKRLDIDKYFEFTLHCREFGMEKNDPEIFRYCADRLGESDMSKVVVFEDASYAASTAKEAGCYVVGMYDKTETHPEIIRRAADQYVADYSELDFTLLPL